MVSSRFPTSGWLDGSVEDLADLVRLVSVPQHAVDRAAEVLEEGIDRRREHPGGSREATALRCALEIAEIAGHDQRAADLAHGGRHHRQRVDLPGTA